MRVVERQAMERVIELLQRDRIGSHEELTAWENQPYDVLRETEIPEPVELSS